MANVNNKRNDRVAADQKLIDGTQKLLTQFATLLVGGKNFAPADIVKVLQEDAVGDSRHEAVRMGPARDHPGSHAALVVLHVDRLEGDLRGLDDERPPNGAADQGSQVDGGQVHRNDALGGDQGAGAACQWLSSG